MNLTNLSSPATKTDVRPAALDRDGHITPPGSENEFQFSDLLSALDDVHGDVLTADIAPTEPDREVSEPPSPDTAETSASTDIALDHPGTSQSAASPNPAVHSPSIEPMVEIGPPPTEKAWISPVVGPDGALRTSVPAPSATLMEHHLARTPPMPGLKGRRADHASVAQDPGHPDVPLIDTQGILSGQADIQKTAGGAVQTKLPVGSLIGPVFHPEDTWFSLRPGQTDRLTIHSEGTEGLSWATRSDVQADLPVRSGPPPTADVSHSVIRQVSQAIRRSPDGAIEISLNPVELGRVRMMMTATDAGITLNVLADRPDTLDLMRRNIDDLARSLRDMGYDDVSFSFGHGGEHTDQQAGRQDQIHDAAPIGTTGSDAPDAPHMLRSELRVAPDAIDMRL